MRGFEVDDRDRARVRQHLPAELIALVDNAEANAQTKIDGIVNDFTGRVRAKIEELAEHDFAAELQEAVNKEQKALIDELSKSAEGLAAKIKAVEAARIDDETFSKAVGALNSAEQELQSELKKTREGVAKLGSTVGKTAKGVISKFLGGIFGSTRTRRPSP